MTQYLLSVIHPADGPEWAQSATPEQIQEVMAAVDVFNGELQAGGNWVFAGGLEPPSAATVVNATGADVMITDGPYAETKEQLGGFWVIEAADLDAALELARRGSAACRDAVEVRPFQSE